MAHYFEIPCSKAVTRLWEWELLRYNTIVKEALDNFSLIPIFPQKKLRFLYH